MNRKKQSIKVIIRTVTRIAIGLILIFGGIFGGLISISEGVQYIEDDGNWLIGGLHGLYVVIYLWIIYLGVALLRNKTRTASQVKWIFILQSPIIAIPSLFTWDWSTGLKAVFIYEQAYGWSIDSLISVPEFHLHFVPSDFSIGLNLASLFLVWVAYRLQVHDINSIESQNIPREENVFSLLMRVLGDSSIKKKICFLIGGCFVVVAVFFAKEKYESSQPTVVLDSREWMRCSVGQAWDGRTCTGQASRLTFDSAFAFAKDLNAKGAAYGKTDWRVPTVRELASLRNCSSGSNDAIDVGDGAEVISRGCYEGSGAPTLIAHFFPNTPAYRFWSSSPYDAYNSWGVGFDYGYVSTNSRDAEYHVRLVRSIQ